MYALEKKSLLVLFDIVKQYDSGLAHSAPLFLYHNSGVKRQWGFAWDNNENPQRLGVYYF